MGRLANENEGTGGRVKPEYCIVCQCELPPLNGIEEEDFAYTCADCWEVTDDPLDPHDFDDMF